MGAGASRGRRKTDNPQYKLEKDEGNILEGLPLVNEIPERLDFHIRSFEGYSAPDSLKNTIFPIGSTGGSGYEQVKDLLVKDLKWLKEESARHATIDTFAKKLYLRGDLKTFYKVEFLLTIFFIIEQLINNVDGRYDTFLASVLTKDLEITDDISILTWNYDSQFEISYKEYIRNDYNNIHDKLRVFDIKTDKSFGAISENRNDDNASYHHMKALGSHKIVKLNGTANFKEILPLTDYYGVESHIYLREILNKYVLFSSDIEDPDYTRLSFAWDNNGYVDNFFDDKIESMVGDAETLVVIGYTFPFFNRETDRRIFEKMPNLSQIYIQDPYADRIIKNIIPVMSDYQKDVMKLSINDGIEPITNVDQFFLPPEL